MSFSYILLCSIRIMHARVKAFRNEAFIIIELALVPGWNRMRNVSYNASNKFSPNLQEKRKGVRLSSSSPSCLGARCIA